MGRKHILNIITHIKVFLIRQFAVMTNSRTTIRLPKHWSKYLLIGNNGDRENRCLELGYLIETKSSVDSFQRTD